MSDELQKLLVTMDVPKGRLNDLHWLRRNLGFHNASHVHFDLAMRLIYEQLKEKKDAELLKYPCVVEVGTHTGDRWQEKAYGSIICGRHKAQYEERPDLGPFEWKRVF